MGFGQDGSVVLKTTDKTNTLLITLTCHITRLTK